jgi:hypothetical protein
MVVIGDGDGGGDEGMVVMVVVGDGDRVHTGPGCIFTLQARNE